MKYRIKFDRYSTGCGFAFYKVQKRLPWLYMWHTVKRGLTRWEAEVLIAKLQKEAK